MKKVLFLAVCLLSVLNRPVLLAEITKNDFKPVSATVCVDNVNIRAGKGLNFEVLGQVNKFDTVVVLGEEFGWYKIQLPKQAASFVHKKFIEQNTVKANKLRVRAGRGENSNILGVLKMGDQVEVLEENGEWLKISPPKNCPGWVKKDYLQFNQKEFKAPILKPCIASTPPKKKIEVSGIIDDLGKIANRPGRHKLIVDKKSFYYLKAENINFNQYIYQKVQITGTLVESKDAPYPILQVEQIKTK